MEPTAELIELVASAIDKELQHQCLTDGDLDLDNVALAAVLAVLTWTAEEKRRVSN